VVALLLAGEPHQVGLDEVRDGPDAAADLADLVARCAASVHTGTSPALSAPYQATTLPSRLVTWNSTGSPGASPRAARPAASRSVRSSSSR